MILIIKTNKREIEIDTNDIPLTNSARDGVKKVIASKLRKGEEVISVKLKEN